MSIRRAAQPRNRRPVKRPSPSGAGHRRHEEEVSEAEEEEEDEEEEVGRLVLGFVVMLAVHFVLIAPRLPLLRIIAYGVLLFCSGRS